MRVRAQTFFLFFFAAIAPTSFTYAFDVYIETNYKNQPDFANYGAKDLRFIYGGSFWSNGQDRQLLPPENRVINTVAANNKDYTELIAINIEHINIWGSDAQVAAGVKKLITILQWVKIGAPKAKVGYYGNVPAPGGSSFPKNRFI